MSLTNGKRDLSLCAHKLTGRECATETRACDAGVGAGVTLSKLCDVYNSSLAMARSATCLLHPLYVPRLCVRSERHVGSGAEC
jgi:hypothetical protein